MKKSKGRLTAEKYMRELDDMRPKLMAAYELWFARRVEYEYVMQSVVVYHKRGLITDEEFERYKMMGARSHDLNKALGEYRKARRLNNG